MNEARIIVKDTLIVCSEHGDVCRSKDSAVPATVRWECTECGASRLF